MLDLVTVRPGLTLLPEAAKSWVRMEQQLGRELDVNRSYADYDTQMALFLAYRAYLSGRGPEAPLALHPDDSWHCRGLAVDTDDDQAVRAMPDHGWKFIVDSEVWHAQYYPGADQHFGRRRIAAPAIQEVDVSALRVISSPYYRASGNQVVHNGMVARSIPDAVALVLREGGISSKDYDEDYELDTELREVWELARAMGNVRVDAITDLIGRRVSDRGREG